MTEYKNKKTTCNKKSVAAVLPEPTAQVIANIVGVSTSYVKKVRTGARKDESEKADTVKYCNELIVEGQKVLLEAVTEIIHNKANN